VVVFVGSQLFVNLAVEIAGSLSGEHAWGAHHPRGYTNERRLTSASIEVTDPSFNPQTRNPKGNQGQLNQLPAQKRFST
jgi:hypothetical protein